jgi:uncharacterized phage protein gp47/JayE
MSSTLDANGLVVETTDDIATAIVTALKTIYGDDINLASNSPDGQMVGIYSQASSDQLDLLMDIYNMFSVDSAYGVGLQRLVALNGMTLRPGTYTTTPVGITTDRALTLPGMDQAVVTPFQIRDANNTWTLISSYVFGAAGTQALVFQCTEMGPISPLPNTINSQATPTLGVIAVNNPTISGTVLGQDEETDPDLRSRHARSFFLASSSPADAVEAGLLSIADVTDAVVIENDTNGTVDGIPAHSIWATVVGGTDAEISTAIYSKKAPGCGTYGAVSAVVIRPNGQGATMYWDIGVEEDLYVQFGLISSVPGITFDEDLIKQQLTAAMVNFWKLGKTATIGDIVRAMYIIEPRAILTSIGVSSDGMSYSDTVSPTSAKYYFTLSAANINIL